MFLFPAEAESPALGGRQQQPPSVTMAQALALGVFQHLPSLPWRSGSQCRGVGVGGPSWGHRYPQGPLAPAASACCAPAAFLGENKHRLLSCSSGVPGAAWLWALLQLFLGQASPSQFPSIDDWASGSVFPLWPPPEQREGGGEARPFLPRGGSPPGGKSTGLGYGKSRLTQLTGQR